MDDKLIDLSVHIDIIESLSRILFEIIREGDNLKKFDTGNLAKIVLSEIIKVKAEFNDIEKYLGI